MKSKRFIMWRSVRWPTTCEDCWNLHGKVEYRRPYPSFRPPLHWFCHCAYVPLCAVRAGEATPYKQDGADWWLKNVGILPAQYITREEALTAGWDPAKGNLDVVCPNQILFGGVYFNRNGHLPTAPGRVWYKADLLYSTGYRGAARIVFSNDGLIFVTYDHYDTFCEIV